MKRGTILSILAGAVGAMGINVTFAAEGQNKIQQGDYVAIIGDSITEQKMYSTYIEDYLLMCKPAANLSTTQFGWSGETSWGFAGRMANDMIPFGATAATINFGMNDGGYSPMDPNKAKHYHDSYTSVVEQLKKAGVKFIVVGSPGCVDSDTFRHDPSLAVMYNKTLGAERDLAKQVAQEQGVVFADVFQPMYDTMEKAKAKYGHGYPLCGGDGVHPGPNGHLVMAYAYLKGLGCDGNIGTITVNLAGNTATATDGHQILSDKEGAIEVESSKYPFCFFGDPKSPDATSGVIEFLPFNEDLNRFMLIVSDAQPGKQYAVTWGKESKTISGEALAKGINLAAEFLENPFVPAAQHVHQAVQAQQNFETPLVKQLLHDLPAYETLVPEKKELFAELRPALLAKDKPLREASEKAVVPVKYKIEIHERALFEGK